MVNINVDSNHHNASQANYDDNAALQVIYDDRKKKVHVKNVIIINNDVTGLKNQGVMSISKNCQIS